MTSYSLPHSHPPQPPPVPVVAQLTAAGRVLVIEFDQEILDQPIAGNQFIARANNRALELSNFLVDEEKVIAAARDAGFDFGPNRVSYTANPPDVVNLEGTPAAAFFNFPLDVSG